MSELNEEQKIVQVYTWVSKAFYKHIKSFVVPETHHKAAQHIAEQGNGFTFDGTTLSWD